MQQSEVSLFIAMKKIHLNYLDDMQKYTSILLFNSC